MEVRSTLCTFQGERVDLFLRTENVVATNTAVRTERGDITSYIIFGECDPLPLSRRAQQIRL